MCIVCAAMSQQFWASGSSHDGIGSDPSAAAVPQQAGVATQGLTGNQNVDGVLSLVKWDSLSLTFSFPASASVYPVAPIHYGNLEMDNNFAQFTAAQQTAARWGFSQVADFTNLTITEQAADTNYTEVDMMLARSSMPPTAWAYYPGPSAHSGDVWFGSGYDSQPINGGANYLNPIKGGYAWMTMIHEIGHALGLKHGHAPDTGNPTILTSDRDSLEFSVMTYRSYVGGSAFGYTNESWGYAQSFMMYDIAALQAMYGADFTTNSGDTTYTFSLTTGEMFINGVGQGAPGGNRIFLTLWDGGGTDTYDFSNYSTDMAIDLTPGGCSLLSDAQRANLGYGNYARANVYNALQHNDDVRSLIENANGGSGNDTITGNSANNILNGGGGNDYLDGGSGADQLFGGEGNDTIVFDASDNLANVQGGNGTDTLLVRLAGTSAGAAPTYFSLTGHGFETAIVETTDSGGSLFTLITETYNAGWQLVSRVTDMDDGRDIIETWDPANANAWTHSSETRNSSGTTTNYNVNFDNGTRYERVFDATGQAWTDYLDNFNASNQLYYRAATYDDGSSYATTFDTQGQAWAQYTDWFNSVGAFYNRTAVYDDGSSYSTFYDVTGQTWTDYTDYRNASNLLYNRTAHYDDGSGYATFYDVTGQSWTEYTDQYNTSWQLLNRTGRYDDGTSYYTAYDVTNAHSWSSYTQYFNSSNVLINTVYTPD